MSLLLTAEETKPTPGISSSNRCGAMAPEIEQSQVFERRGWGVKARAAECACQLQRLHLDDSTASDLSNSERLAEHESRVTPINE